MIDHLANFFRGPVPFSQTQGFDHLAQINTGVRNRSALLKNSNTLAEKSMHRPIGDRVNALGDGIWAGIKVAFLTLAAMEAKIAHETNLFNEDNTLFCIRETGKQAFISARNMFESGSASQMGIRDYYSACSENPVLTKVLYCAGKSLEALEPYKEPLAAGLFVGACIQTVIAYRQRVANQNEARRNLVNDLCKTYDAAAQQMEREWTSELVYTPEVEAQREALIGKAKKIRENLPLIHAELKECSLTKDERTIVLNQLMVVLETILDKTEN